MSVERTVSSHLQNILGHDPCGYLENSILENIVRCFVPSLKAVQHFIC